MQGFSIIANNLKTTALRRTLWPERADDHMTSGLHRSGDLADVGDTAALSGKKMKDRAVMPYIVGSGL